MANPELGAKQVCPNCQSKFYDLNKRPAHCPKCETEFDPEELLRNRRGARGRPAPNYEDDQPAEKPVRDEEAEDLEEEADATPEIDKAAEEPAASTDDDDDSDAPAEPDVGVSEDFGDEEEAEADTDDVPFLEDEEEDDFADEDIDVAPGDAEEER